MLPKYLVFPISSEFLWDPRFFYPPLLKIIALNFVLYQKISYFFMTLLLISNACFTPNPLPNISSSSNRKITFTFQICILVGRKIFVIVAEDVTPFTFLFRGSHLSIVLWIIRDLESNKMTWLNGLRSRRRGHTLFVASSYTIVTLHLRIFVIHSWCCRHLDKEGWFKNKENDFYWRRRPL